MHTPHLKTIAYLGGNGHGQVRLERAHGLLKSRVRLSEVLYPGFQGGPPAAHDFAAFLSSVEAELHLIEPDLVYATGVGGLVALCLRSEGRLSAPLVLQGPVLWGLETRLMPRLMRRVPGAAAGLQNLFRNRLFRNWFGRRHFVVPLPGDTVARFYAGYDACPTLPAFFGWLTPDLLRRLETQYREHPERFREIRLWWGGKDRVVPLSDWDLTKERLGVDWPLEVFADWGHYPSLEHPEAWVEELIRVATT